jgi:ribonucleotide reductase alpha subunit
VYNKVLRKILEWMGMWTNETIDHLIVYKGSIKNMTVPSFLKNVFRTIWEIPQKALIDMASDRQHFIDQSQSFNIYLQDPDMEKLTKIHFYGWKKGLKTGSYYVRSRSSISSSNVTVDPSKEKPCESCSA